MSETIVQPKRKTKRQEKTLHLPRYHVILLNDDDHSFEYVIRMLFDLFSFPIEKGFMAAKEVHEKGMVIVFTGPKETAEFKQEQIHGYGADKGIERSAGSMTAILEAAD